MGKPSAPPAPDYAAAATATGQSSIAAAQVNAQLDRANEVTPYGTSTWTNNGGNSYTDTMSLSAPEQALLNSQLSNQQGIATTSGKALGAVESTMGTPMSSANVNPLQTSVSGANSQAASQQAIAAAYNQATMPLNQRIGTATQSEQAQLLNSGFQPGSAGYNQAMTNFNQTNNSAYQSAYDSAVGQGQNEQNIMFNQGMANANLGNQSSAQQLQQDMSLYNQPLNEYNALMTGAQVTNPTFNSTNVGANAQGANYLGAAQDQGQYDTSVYNAGMASSNALLGALGTAGGLTGMAYVNGKL